MCLPSSLSPLSCQYPLPSSICVPSLQSTPLSSQYALHLVYVCLPSSLSPLCCQYPPPSSMCAFPPVYPLYVVSMPSIPCILSFYPRLCPSSCPSLSHSHTVFGRPLSLLWFNPHGLPCVLFIKFSKGTHSQQSIFINISCTQSKLTWVQVNLRISFYGRIERLRMLLPALWMIHGWPSLFKTTELHLFSLMASDNILIINKSFMCIIFSKAHILFMSTQMTNDTANKTDDIMEVSCFRKKWL